jgi:hypothetical protein
MHHTGRKEATISRTNPRPLLTDLDIGFALDNPANLLHFWMSMTDGAFAWLYCTMQKLDVLRTHSLCTYQPAVGRAGMIGGMIPWYIAKIQYEFALHPVFPPSLFRCAPPSCLPGLCLV